MCGRAYHTYSDEELYVRYLSDKTKRRPKLEITPNYNMAPTHQTPVVLERDGERTIELMHWGLIAPWSPEFKMKFSTINARSEDVFEKPMYKKAILKRRCIVPLSGFIEWKAGAKEKDPKTPFKIYLDDEPIMSFAGIWESWHEGQEDEQHSFSLMTTSANSFMEAIHHRMPVILSKEDESAWLDSKVLNPEEIAALMQLRKPQGMSAVKISTAINSPKNNRADVLMPDPNV